MADLAVGVDIGGTKIAGGLVDADGAIRARTRRSTPADDPDRISDLVAEVHKELSAQHGPLPCGVGAPGPIDLDGVVRYAPNIAYADYPLRAILADRLGVAVTVDNDANVAAWGEYRAGAGAGVHDSMLMLTLGTGVGGGLVVDGLLQKGANGMGAEFGHIIVAEGGPRCPCGNRGCLEPLASGTAIGRLAREARAGGGRLDATLDTDPELTGKDVTLAAKAGNQAAVAVLAEVGFWLGVGIASLVNALDPELVVVGGGAMTAGELILGPARDAFGQRIIGRGFRTLTPVVQAQLGNDAGIVGAALLALAAP